MPTDTVMTAHKGAWLTGLARHAIGMRLGMVDDIPPADEAWMRKPAASFVTLHKHGVLRGCIGSIIARRALAEDVAANALAAAFEDPRFPPLADSEFDDIDIEVSLLSSPEPIHPSDEQALQAMLRPGVDGVILEYGIHRATFLPQVWEQLPTAADFLAHLKLKAGLTPDFWDPDIQWSRYGVQAFHETEGDAS